MTDHPLADRIVQVMELARRLQQQEHDRIVCHVQLALSDRESHGSMWPGPISHAFKDCAHPDCQLVQQFLAPVLPPVADPEAIHE